MDLDPSVLGRGDRQPRAIGGDRQPGDRLDPAGQPGRSRGAQGTGPSVCVPSTRSRIVEPTRSSGVRVRMTRRRSIQPGGAPSAGRAILTTDAAEPSTGTMTMSDGAARLEVGGDERRPGPVRRQRAEGQRSRQRGQVDPGHGQPTPRGKGIGHDRVGHEGTPVERRSPGGGRRGSTTARPPPDRATGRVAARRVRRSAPGPWPRPAGEQEQTVRAVRARRRSGRRASDGCTERAAGPEGREPERRRGRGRRGRRGRSPHRPPPPQGRRGSARASADPLAARSSSQDVAAEERAVAGVDRHFERS